MDFSRWACVMVACGLGQTVWGADAPRPTRPSRPPVVVSPEVHADGRVTLRLLAPRAQEVEATGPWGSGRTPLTREENGVWSITVGPVVPGVHEYSFQVDGMTLLDPANPAIKPMRQPRTSILHLPGNPPLIHDFRDVPHGTVHHHTYWSKSLGRPRELVVYTPPGYERESNRRYPVLYLFHGSGDTQATWTVHGKAHWILDNLLAEEKARPMVVAMLDGHAVVRPGAWGTNSAAFERDLVEDALPYVEERYRVATDAAGRAIAGLSMGGEQSLRIGLNRYDQFAWIAGFSSAAPGKESIGRALSEPQAANEAIRLLWIGCGKDDFLLDRNEALIEALKAAGVRHEWHLTEGNHSWPVWRRYLAELYPRLFR
ncbi:MAG: esterase [Verrucomicrobiae bacterium]|nr:esterase [Verrucomicrobiae bacterium]